jgi:hypothetical protein
MDEIPTATVATPIGNSRSQEIAPWARLRMPPRDPKGNWELWHQLLMMGVGLRSGLLLNENGRNIMGF